MNARHSFDTNRARMHRGNRWEYMNPVSVKYAGEL